MKTKIQVIVVGQIPPPVSGAAIMIERMLRLPFSDIDVTHVPMNFARTLGEMGRFSWRKALAVPLTIGRIVATRIRRGPAVLHYPASGINQLAVLRDSAVLLATRWMFRRTILHFYASGIAEYFPKYPLPLRALLFLAYRRVDAVVRVAACTPDAGNLFQARSEYFIPHFAEDLRLQIPSDSERQWVGSTAVLLFAASIRESKGILVLLQAISQLRRQGVAIDAQILGEFLSPEFKAEVEDLMVQLRIEENVTFLGIQHGKDYVAAFARSDIFCMPTFYESEALPNVVLDAMSIGLPVVASNWRGIPTAVDHGLTGFLVEPKSVTALASRILELCQDRPRAKQMGERGRRKFELEFSRDVFMRRVETMVKDVAKSRRRSFLSNYSPSIY